MASQNMASTRPDTASKDEGSGEYLETVDQTATHATYFDDASAQISPNHRQYLIDRHGTHNLDPVPDMGDADPYNWPTWKVSTIGLIAFE